MTSAAAPESEPRQSGVVFPAGPDGRTSTMAVNQAIFADAVRGVSPAAADRVQAEKDWRGNYVDHIVELVHIGLESAENAMAISRDGVNAAVDAMRFARDGDTMSVTEAMASFGEATVGSATVRGGRSDSVDTLAVPYRGEVLSGDSLQRQLDDWTARGIVEPSFAESIRLVIENPDWLDLSDRTVAVMGAGSEMGPYPLLCQWGADVWAIDLPRPDVWERVLATARRGAGSVTVPVPIDHPLAGQSTVSPTDDGTLAQAAGLNLLTQTPETRTWLAQADGPLTVGNYVYADGGVHVRLSVAIDAIMTSLQADRPDCSFAFLATPTDVFVVPADAVADAKQRYRNRQVPGLFERPVGMLSGNNLFVPHYRNVEPGADRAVVNNLVARQGPNYALAKRLQRWRASVARDEGATVSLNIAPPTRTKSVVKNRVFALAYGGMGRFGLEVFDPPASNALMAAMLVHDLRNPQSTAAPDVALEHPLDLFIAGANPGGMWRCPYEPNSIMAAAAVAGLFERRA